MKATLKQLRERRDKAIAFLDKEVPNWRDKVHKDNLDMASTCDCIASQIAGMEYEMALEQLGLSREEAMNYAFCTGTNWLEYDSEEEMEEDYAKLTKVWKEVL